MLLGLSLNCSLVCYCAYPSSKANNIMLLARLRCTLKIYWVTFLKVLTFYPLLPLLIKWMCISFLRKESGTNRGLPSKEVDRRWGIRTRELHVQMPRATRLDHRSNTRYHAAIQPSFREKGSLGNSRIITLLFLLEGPITRFLWVVVSNLKETPFGSKLRGWDEVVCQWTSSCRCS